jgi:hypothetical protein
MQPPPTEIASGPAELVDQHNAPVRHVLKTAGGMPQKPSEKSVIKKQQSLLLKI